MSDVSIGYSCKEWQEFLAKMATVGQCVEQPILFATAAILGVRIEVIWAVHNVDPVLVLPAGVSKDRHITVAFLPQTQHYESVACKHTSLISFMLAYSI